MPEIALRGPHITLAQAVKAAGQKVVEAAPAREAKLRADLAAATDDAAKARMQRALDGIGKDVAAAKTNLEKFKGDERSIIGLEKPAFELRNPGLVSIPLGFLAVVLGSLLYRDRRADDMWDELYARQNTGILAARAAAH